EVVARDRVGDLVGLLERVRRDAREVLLAVPRAAVRRIPQPRHDFEQFLDFAHHGLFPMILLLRLMRMWAVRPQILSCAYANSTIGTCTPWGSRADCRSLPAAGREACRHSDA